VERVCWAQRGARTGAGRAWLRRLDVKGSSGITVMAMVSSIVAVAHVSLVAPGRVADVRLRGEPVRTRPAPARVAIKQVARLRSRTIPVTIAAPDVPPRITPALQVESTPDDVVAGTPLLAAAGVPSTQLKAPPEPVPVTRPRAPRPLAPLYVSFAGLQVLDYQSTQRGIRAGAVEANPVAGALQQHPAGIIAAKAAVTAGVIFAGERMWKRNRVGAVVFVTAMNVGMATVVAHNYRVTRSLEGR
jgi:hypothetical protein